LPILLDPDHEPEAVQEVALKELHESTGATPPPAITESAVAYVRVVVGDKYRLTVGAGGVVTVMVSGVAAVVPPGPVQERL
jgi:hypothetical protein